MATELGLGAVFGPLIYRKINELGGSEPGVIDMPARAVRPGRKLTAAELAASPIIPEAAPEPETPEAEPADEAP